MDLTAMIDAGAVSPLVLVAVALAMGALHGLEPGHSKTMMAAYIIAVRGTVGQAVLLGLSAALSHVVVVWALALAALTYGDALIGEALEPIFMMASGMLVFGFAVWMFITASRQGAAQGSAHTHHHAHTHTHDHPHHHALAHADAHTRAHAADISARLSSGRTGTWQTVLFGLSGGLIPCPAAITVALFCLHLGKFSLGVTLVGAFSVGLAATLVVIGVVAALGLGFAASRMGALERLVRLGPWLSVGLIGLVGVLMIYAGALHMADHH